MARTFVQELAAQLNRDKKSTEALLEALSRVIVQEAASLESIAMAGFGTFGVVKHDEQVVNDLDGGRAMLLPPEIKIEFKAATRLRKIAENADR